MLNRLCAIWIVVGFIYPGTIVQTVHAQSAIDQILVTVNNVPITESEIESRVNWLNFLARNAGQSQISASAARTQAIDDAIAYQLMSQLAQRTEVTVADNEVQQRLSEIVASNNVTESQFFGELEAQGVSKQAVANSIFESVLNDKLIEQFVIPRINVRDEEINRYLELNPDEFQPSEEYHLSVIVVAESLTMSFEQKQLAKQVVRDIEQALERGADFFEIASAASTLNVVQTGELGWVQKAQLDPQLAQVLSPSKVSQVVGPITSGINTFFCLINQHRLGPDPELPMLREFRLSRIVMQASNEAGAKANVEKLEELRNSILTGAKFAEIAKVYSHDATTRKNGGDLGWIPEDTLPIQYIEPLSEISVGKVSSVQQVGNIAFILNFQDIRQAGPDDRARSVIRNRLRTVRLRSERASWLDELRENAVVDFRATF